MLAESAQPYEDGVVAITEAAFNTASVHHGNQNLLD